MRGVSSWVWAGVAVVRLMAYLLLVTGSAWGESLVREGRMPSRALQAEVPYTVYLPDGHARGGLLYPVLYLLHGHGGNERNWLDDGQVQSVLDRLIGSGQVPPMIVVMPGGGTSWWVDGNDQAAGTMLVDELVAHVEATLPALAEREGRMIAGLSAGGYGTVVAALRHPERFAAAAALSPAIYAPTPPPNSAAWQVPAFRKDGRFDQASWDRLGYPALWERYRQLGRVVPMFVASGDHDELSIAWHATQFYQRLFEHQPKDVALRIIDGGHDWGVWRTAIDEALRFMGRRVSPPRAPPAR